MPDAISFKLLQIPIRFTFRKETEVLHIFQLFQSLEYDSKFLGSKNPFVA